MFSPARFSTLPGLRFPGRLSRYPTRDDMARYLSDFATHFELPVRTRARVLDTSWDGEAFEVTLADGDLLTARAVIAASGGFGRPVIPELPGATSYTGRLVHSANYHSADGYTGQRVVVVGAGNSAVQIAVELAEVANVTLATRAPIRFVRQAPLGIDLHYWARWSGLESLPLSRRTPSRRRVLDDGRYAAAVAAGRPDQRQMFKRLTTAGVIWPDGTHEHIDSVILATGYRPDVDYLAATGALDNAGWPIHCRGLSLTVPRLGYVGLPGQTGVASATVRGVAADARRVTRHLGRAIHSQVPQPLRCKIPATAARQFAEVGVGRQAT
ncbi:MAG TPA: NAD(P)/FAD-dependent oxidoreductase [Propionibacteriaceae bacterium]|nr:NAD(P)/FAD-dependent oxidoreductase [Propionibacteriaceae bacterium]